MLDQITPVILTLNEAPNIGRVLSRLTWAKDIVVVDSFSQDETPAIAGGFDKVRFFSRAFDSHAGQWRYAVAQTGIASPWILRLDADYLLTDELIEEMKGLDPDAPANAYRISFDYAVCGKRLRASLYPPNTVLFRAGRFVVVDRGHTEAWTIEGPVLPLRGRILHDDRKSLEQWATSQARYMAREAERLAATPKGLRDWLRLHPPLMLFLAFFYCLFGRGLILDGRAGLFYALQRLAAEAILSLKVIEKKLNHFDPRKPPPDGPNP